MKVSSMSLPLVASSVAAENKPEPLSFNRRD
jgi:hypothetical protein